ncbi:MAG: hypothetical protein EB078_09150 [Proteobacteria bacterium]|jgi:hypothetical protein|nr:hypothetical protein [Pseudomonadota bacterium]NDD05061.1 hypothetical protein [Pseudomonadota bacterium]
MLKPHRGPQAPSFQSSGISHLKLIRFLEDAQRRCEEAGEKDSAFRFEMMVEYFRKDYVPGKPLAFTGMVLGF